MNQHIITTTVNHVKDTLADAEGGHDWWHIYRVWQAAKQIAKGENADLLVVELGALLHDIADSKFNGGDETIGPLKAKAFLDTLQLDTAVIDHVVKIVANISFKGGKEKQQLIECFVN